MGDERSGPAIALTLLGAMRLAQDGVDLPLPASRKTRALLAYLALAGRPVRRDFLCELLWAVPDDPRGALRWSLSKLRGLVDTPERARLTATGETVTLDMGDIDSDWHALRDGVKGAVDAMPLSALRRLAALQGEFLAGLQLPRCDPFQAWLLAIREDSRRWQVALLAALTRRSTDAEEALQAARQWTELAPFDADARMALLAILERTGRGGEVKGQRALAVGKLEEGELAVPHALRQGGSVGAGRSMADDALHHQVRFCLASDGTGLAWSRVGDGDGLPLVKTANWLNHLDYDFDSPVWRHWIRALARGRSLIRYDERGNGLSDWDTPDISFDAFVDDLASVVDAAELERFDLLAVSQGCCVAIAYAVRHPDRVRRLVLYGGFAAGWRARGDMHELARRDAMMTLMRHGWGQNNPAFRQMYTTLFFPDASQAEMDRFNELQRMTTSPLNAERLSEAFAKMDVRHLLEQVSVPTLVMHAREDAVAPFSVGRAVAAGIPGAQFVALESRNHLLLESEPAWEKFMANISAFLA